MSKLQAVKTSRPKYPSDDIKFRRKYNKKYFTINPWVKTYCGVEARCTGKKQRSYKRGIKNLMKTSDFKFLWFRDKAWLLKKPSIDRIDGKGHYSLDNCRFIELKENITRTRSNGFRVKQLTLEGKLVKIWANSNEAKRFGGFWQSNINKCCRGVQHTSDGFRWEFAEDRCQKN